MPEIVDLSTPPSDDEVELYESMAEPEERDDTLAIIEARNRALMDEIHALGGQIPPAIMQQVQHDMLVDLLWPPGTPFRRMYELMLEDRLTGVLEHLKQATIRGRLTDGIH